MRAQGMEPTSRVLVLDMVPADDVLAHWLSVRPGARLVHLERLRLADGEPMAIERTYLSAARFPRLRQHLVRLGSLYAALDSEYGVRPVEAEETIETALASPEEAALLGVDTGLPLLLLSRHSLDAEGEPVEYVRSVYRGDRYKFVTRLSRPEADPGRRPVSVLLVSGTGTGVGKTVVTAAVAALARAARPPRRRGQAGADRRRARRAGRPRRGRPAGRRRRPTATSSPATADAARARDRGAAGRRSTGLVARGGRLTVTALAAAPRPGARRGRGRAAGPLRRRTAATLADLAARLVRAGAPGRRRPGPRHAQPHRADPGGAGAPRARAGRRRARLAGRPSRTWPSARNLADLETARRRRWRASLPAGAWARCDRRRSLAAAGPGWPRSSAARFDAADFRPRRTRRPTGRAAPQGRGDRDRHPRTRRATRCSSEGVGLDEAQVLAVLRLPDDRLDRAARSSRTRCAMRWCGPEVEVEGIVSVKTGGCPEDCHFCSQSGLFDSPVRAAWLDIPSLVAGRRARPRRPARPSSASSPPCAGPDERLMAQMREGVAAIRAAVDINVAASLGHAHPGAGRRARRRWACTATTTTSRPRARTSRRSSPRTPGRSAGTRCAMVARRRHGGVLRRHRRHGRDASSSAPSSPRSSPSSTRTRSR